MPASYEGRHVSFREELSWFEGAIPLALIIYVNGGCPGKMQPGPRQDIILNGDIAEMNVLEVRGRLDFEQLPPSGVLWMMSAFTIPRRG